MMLMTTSSSSSVKPRAGRAVWKGFKAGSRTGTAESAGRPTMMRGHAREGAVRGVTASCQCPRPAFAARLPVCAERHHVDLAHDAGARYW